MFDGLTLPKSQVKVHVLSYPKSVEQAYRDDDGWGEFNIVADLTPQVSVESMMEIFTYVSKPKFATVQYFDENGEEHPDGLFSPMNEKAIVKPVITNSKYEFVSWEFPEEGKEYVTENPSTHELTIQLSFVVENGAAVPLFPNMLTLNVGKVDPDGIKDIQGSKDLNDSKDSNDFNDLNVGWFDLSGRKFNEKPSKPGLYIKNGRKVVIK